jgi:two-component system response regulator AlgR
MKVLIVDDEKPARDRLRQLVDDFGDHEVVGEAANGERAIEIATQVAPDVVLLDIRMPGVDGIETAHHLNAMERPPAVVFTTAYDEYAVDAFDAQWKGTQCAGRGIESRVQPQSRLRPAPRRVAPDSD